MKTTLTLIAVLLLNYSGIAQQASFTVLAAKGSALSQRANNPDEYVNLKTGTEIFKGDKIIISDSKTYLGIVDNKGNTMELKKAGVYNSDELLKALEMSKGNLAQKYIDYLVKDMTKESEAAAHNMSVTGAVDRSTDVQQINLFIPNGVETMKGKVAVKWLDVTKSGSYQVELLNMFDEVVLKETVEGSLWKTDLSKINAEAGEPLKLKVTASDDKNKASKPVAFKLSDEAKTKEVKNQAPADASVKVPISAASNFVIGGYYQKQGLYMNALYYFSKAKEAEPEVETYNKAYNGLLYMMGMQ